MTTNIPQHFDEAFLSWFQERTEEAWQRYKTKTFEEYVAGGIGGSAWQQGTRWLGGLSEEEIAVIEQRYDVRFPPDYRLFLRVLHSVDRPMVGARYVDAATMVPVTTPSFYNWHSDTEIEAAYEWPFEGLFYDVQYNGLWPQTWGIKPRDTEAQKALLRELLHAAPRLIPVFGHRYLLAEPCAAGNPVLSIYQSDIIILCDDLHSYFLTEYGGLINAAGSGIRKTPEQREAYQTIPFWGEFISQAVPSSLGQAQIRPLKRSWAILGLPGCPSLSR